MLQNSDAEKKVIRRIAVFCGSSRGTERIFEEQAYELGKTLAVQNIELVYGGANVGLMGTVANGVMENGGKAIGVLPAFLKKVEIANLNLTELVPGNPLSVVLLFRSFVYINERKRPTVASLSQN